MIRLNALVSFTVSFGLLSLYGSLALAAPAKVEVQVVAPAPGSISTYSVSSNGVSVATLAMKGSRSLIVIDGVEGPLFDELLNKTGNPSLTTINSVLFSADGKHHAYAARLGDNYIVVRDGHEIYRAPFANLAFQEGDGELILSPEGRHVSFLEKVAVPPSGHGWRLVVDGSPGPLSSNNNSFRLFFSPDGSRWAYIAAKLGGARDESFAVVDGKQVPYLGRFIQFTPENKLVVLAPAADGTFTLHVEGKPMVKGVWNPETKVWVAPAGSHLAAVLKKSGGQIALWIDGQEISAAVGAKDIVNVTFSPDGRRYIATCQTDAAAFAVVDGKKGMEYKLISLPMFTRDSSRALYVGSAGSKNFLITEGQESDGFEIIGGQYVKIAMPQKGPRFAYTTGDGMNRIFSLVADTNPVVLNNKAPVADSLAFSPDGSRYALVAAQVGRSEVDTLIIDGQEIPDMYPQTILQGAPNTAQRESFFIFSPDGKYIANAAVNGAKQKRGLYINHQLVYASDVGISRAAFTPDSKHLIWASAVPGKGTPIPAMAWFVDGTLAVEVPGYPWDAKGTWEMTTEGVYQFVTIADKVVKRFRITPSADTNIDMMISDAATAQAKAIADAAAAKQKAEEDALAAKQKAAADRAAALEKSKADHAAAVAKRKADHDAAVAAKAKARQDAIDAKARARAGE